MSRTVPDSNSLLHNQAGERLRRLAPTIMDRWVARAVLELSASGQDSLALRDSLPDHFNKLADFLCSHHDATNIEIRRAREESKRSGKGHGRERAQTLGYTIDQLIYEYRIFRETIFDVLEEEISLTPFEREVIVCSIEEAVNDAATEFSKTLEELREILAAALTHDLRGPIISTSLRADLLLKDSGNNPKTLATAAAISKDMKRLGRMVEEVLDATRLKAGEGIALKYAACDLSSIIRETVENLSLNREVEFVVNAEDSCVGFWNARALFRLVENLLSNAVKYRAPQSPITINLIQNDHGADLEIHNEGDPISAADQNRLFLPFARTGSAESEKGWGLGLTIVKSVVEAHKGTIAVESAQDKGTTFKVHLPRDPRVVAISSHPRYYHEDQCSDSDESARN